MTISTLRIATRKSPLALWQAHCIEKMINHYFPHLAIELFPMTTSGDKFFQDKLLVHGGKGLFVKELEDALLTKQADIAVHSMKDVPAILPPSLVINTICARHDARDALIAKKNCRFSELPKESILGTSSLRRAAQILNKRPDLQIKTLRGNINTRLKKLQSEEYDAIVLAAAGLYRMNQQDLITEIFSEDLMLPACGQGALGIECREEDEHVKRILAPLHDPLSSLCVHVERQVNLQLGGNCHIPLAVFCSPKPNEQLLLQAKVLSADGQIVIYDEQRGPSTQAMHLAEACVANLLRQGAQQLLDASWTH